jgi:hypothetical protein
MGVAKMRRRILKEQKAQRLQSINDSEALQHSYDARLESELVAEMAAMGVTAKMVREGVDVCGNEKGVGGVSVSASRIQSGGKKKSRGRSFFFFPPMAILSRMMTLLESRLILTVLPWKESVVAAV